MGPSERILMRVNSYVLKGTPISDLPFQTIRPLQHVGIVYTS